MVRTLLVVDDDLSFRTLATQVLASWGHVVVGEAGTIRAALRDAVELRPDTVLADIGLPDGDGFTLTVKLLELEHPPRVILVSSHDDAAYGPAALRAGARGFVPKDELARPELRRLIEEG